MPACLPRVFRNQTSERTQDTNINLCLLSSYSARSWLLVLAYIPTRRFCIGFGARWRLMVSKYIPEGEGEQRLLDAVLLHMFRSASPLAYKMSTFPVLVPISLSATNLHDDTYLRNSIMMSGTAIAHVVSFCHFQPFRICRSVEGTLLLSIALGY